MRLWELLSVCIVSGGCFSSSKLRDLMLWLQQSCLQRKQMIRHIVIACDDQGITYLGG